MTSPTKKRKAGDAELEEAFKAEVAKNLPARRSTRTRRVPEETAAGRQFIVAPSYESWADSRAGGKHSSAILGPGALLSANSDAVSTLPAAIRSVRRAYPEETFAAGHLLNAELGGDGTTAKNLTILTSSANGGYKNFDNNVKSAVGQLKKAYASMNKLGIDVSKLKYGIQVDVTVNDDWWGEDYPDNCVSTGVVGTAVVSGEPDVDALFEAQFPDEADRPDRWEALLEQVREEMANVSDYSQSATDNGDIANDQP
jgi:hypothetical protein